MKEIERKFLFVGDVNWLTPIEIIQGYLMLDEKQQLRVRKEIIPSPHFPIKEYTMTYKNMVSDVEHDEIEVEINQEQGEKLLSLAKYTLTKTRYSRNVKDQRMDIDFYPDGLKIVEIEYPSNKNIKDDNILQAYCGEEITGNPKYSNIEIAKTQTMLKAALELSKQPIITDSKYRTIKESLKFAAKYGTSYNK